MKRTMEEWIRLARQGDETAVSYLYEQTYNSVFQSVRAIVKDEDEAMDIVQDSYIKGFQNLQKLEDPEKYQAWMKRLASNMALDHLRKKRPALFSERVDEEGQEIDLRQEDDCLDHMPEEVIDRQETTRLMNEILGKLSQEQRLAVVLFYYEERSVREIAEMLSCSENTVKSRLNYGRKKIEAEVLALEKRGTKLYSLAPLPFFLWVVRMAKGYGIALETAASATAMGAAGAAAAAGETAAAGGTAAGSTAAAATTAGSSAAGSAGTAAAVKTAGTAAGKTLATKIVAGTLAATMTVGAGVTVIHNRNIEKENAAAHVVYEEILDRYRAMTGLTNDEQFRNEDLFWDEILVSTLRKYPNEVHGPDITREYIEQNTVWESFDYNAKNDFEYYYDLQLGNELEQDIPMPDTIFFATMDPRIYDDEIYWSEGENGQELLHSQKYAIADVDGNGIHDLVLKNKTTLNGENWQIYTFVDGYLHCGSITPQESSEGGKWIINEYGSLWGWTIDGIRYVIYIDSFGHSHSKDSRVTWAKDGRYKEPDLDWQVLCRAEQEETAGEENEAPETTVETEETEPEETVDPYEAAIENLAGTYRYYIPLGHIVVSHTRVSGSAFHEFRVTVTDEEIIIEDLGEPQESVDNRSAFVQRLEEKGYTMKEEDYQNIVFGNLGTMRIDRSSIQFVEDTLFNGRVISSSIMTFDATRFEGPTAPTGYVDAMRMDVLFFNYNHSGNHPGLMMSHGINYQRYSWVHGIDLVRYDNG